MVNMSMNEVTGLTIEETCGFIDGHLTEANNLQRLRGEEW